MSILKCYHSLGAQKNNKDKTLLCVFFKEIPFSRAKFKSLRCGQNNSVLSYLVHMYIYKPSVVMVKTYLPVGLYVCHNLQERQEVTLPCSNRNLE